MLSPRGPTAYIPSSSRRAFMNLWLSRTERVVLVCINAHFVILDALESAAALAQYTQILRVSKRAMRNEKVVHVEFYDVEVDVNITVWLDLFANLSYIYRYGRIDTPRFEIINESRFWMSDETHEYLLPLQFHCYCQLRTVLSVVFGFGMKVVQRNPLIKCAIVFFA